MKIEQTFKGIALDVVIRLLCMAVVGVLLLLAHTYLVQTGRVPIDLDLNIFLHFIATAAVGVTATFLLEKGKNIVMLIATGILYVLLLFISVVIYDGLSGGAVYGILGGLTGVAISFLTGMSQKKKSSRWKVKKYGC